MANTPINSNLSSLGKYFNAQLETRINLPTEEGSALPNVAYTSEEFYQLEQQTVFRNNWVFAAFTHQLPEVGDMLPCDVGGQPIVIVRGEDLKIRAFHNVCRHRGAQLVQEPQSAKRNFICPNHSWTYELNGKLKSRPHFYGGGKHDINAQDCHRADLVEVNCDIWFDWIFVNVQGSAGDLCAYLEPVIDKLATYDFSQLHFSTSFDIELKANWKLAIENFIEPYHVFSCHPWLNDFVSMQERDPPQFKDHVLSCGYEFKKTDPARGGELPWFPNLPVDKQNRGDWYVLFPNFAFEIFPDQVDVFIATPLAANRCRETIALYFNGAGALGNQYEEARNHVIQNWRDLNHEDIGVIERMQAGRYSEGFDGGVLSPYWDPVQQHFARLIYSSIEQYL